MAEQRRYTDEEVRTILERATRADHSDVRRSASATGLTLPEIQSIASEVGIAPDVVARAAASIQNTRVTPPVSSWGMPIEVSRTVPLRRNLTDAEWDRLVAELRATFRARGRVSVLGGVREWSNGNLHAAIEPTDTGYQLRMGTVKGNAPALNAVGAGAVGAAAILAGATAISGAAPDLAGPLMLGLSGVGAFVVNLVRLPRWAGERSRQMAHMEEKVLGLVPDQ